MVGRFADLKAKTRKVVHATFAVSALYFQRGDTTGIPVSVKWHNKQALMGQFNDNGYAEVIEGIERLIFDVEELTARGIELNRLDEIQIIQPGYESRFSLDVRDPIVGPVEIKWRVARMIDI